MANNRMYLAHTRVDFCLFLGKNLGGPWYRAPAAEKIEEFYDLVFAEVGSCGHYFLFNEDHLSYSAGLRRDDGFHPLIKSLENK